MIHILTALHTLQLQVNSVMNDLAIIVPSRSRPQNIQALIDSFEDTKAQCTLVVVVDDDDPTLDEYNKLSIPLLIQLPREGKGMARPLNRAALTLRGEFSFFGFMGDDHRPRTPNWDEIFIAELADMPTGLVYGNDLLQGKRLPTQIVMTANIVDALGGMVPPGFEHLYLDNFWLQLGTHLDVIKYLDDVIIEHMHPFAGKGEMDAQYQEVNDQSLASRDQQRFIEYINSPEYQELLAALR